MKISLLSWALYMVIGIALGAAGVDVSQWQFWVVLVSIVLIDVLSHFSGLKKGANL